MHYNLSFKLSLYDQHLTAEQMASIIQTLNTITPGKVHIKEHFMDNDGWDELEVFIQTP